MADSSKATLSGVFTARPGQRGDAERWPVPQTMMLVMVLSVSLWALIFAAAGWLFS